LKLDLIFNFDKINNVEIEKHKCNITKGLVGMNRDINLLLVGFFYSDSDAREVFLFILFYFTSIRCYVLKPHFISGKTTSCLKKKYRIYPSVSLMLSLVLNTHIMIKTLINLLLININ
jgi:hypothetical protein